MPNREEVIKLKENGSSYAKIASALNMPIGTARSICLRKKRNKTLNIAYAVAKNSFKQKVKKK